MFDIVLYNTIDENKKVDKRLQDGFQLTGTLRNETDIINPIVLIELNNLAGYNYCYIEVWKRYYYIKEVVSIRTGIVELHLEVDPLMSFRDQIRKIPAIIDKQASLSQANMYIDDGDWVVQNNDFIQIRNFESGFNDEGEFILIAAGGQVIT